MDPSEIQEVDKSDPDLSVKQDESEKPANATCVSAVDMILESLWQLDCFKSTTEDKSVIHRSLLNLRSLNQPLEAFDLFLNILETLPGNSYFEVIEVAKKICNRCKMDTEYFSERSFGLILNANSLRTFKSAFKDFTFENILKLIRMNLKMPCDKEGCGKPNYVQHMIEKLPSVFTIALEWEKNETEGEIFDTTSVLATEIDISVIYQYRGDSAFTKYRLVSMVCSHGVQYNCVAYENNGWVRYSGSEKEVIGDWDSVVSTFKTQNIQPHILFFESVTSSSSASGSSSGSYGSTSGSSGSTSGSSDDEGDVTTDSQLIQTVAYWSFIAGRVRVTMRNPNTRTSLVEDVPSLLLQAFNAGWNYGNSAPPETALGRYYLTNVVADAVKLASFHTGRLLESLDALFDHQTPKNLPVVYFSALRLAWIRAGIFVGSYMLGTHGYVKDLALLNFQQFFSYDRF